eukprot:1639677-Rhodomonas_salina.5
MDKERRQQAKADRNREKEQEKEARKTQREQDRELKIKQRRDEQVGCARIPPLRARAFLLTRMKTRASA